MKTEEESIVPEIARVETEEFVSLPHREAVAYAERGWPVFPVWPTKDKNPMTSNGFKDASTDVTVIKRWWARNPYANIGIRTGKASGLFVLDVDVKNGDGFESLKKLTDVYGELPETRTHRTASGGKHYLFVCPPEEVGSSRDRIGTWLDIRCEDGYIVAPPSEIEGKRYEVLNPDVPIAEAPEWLVTLAREVKKQEPKPKAKVISEGSRNETIFREALKCKRSGMPVEDACTQMFKLNLSCDPPLEDAEVEKVVNSAYRYEVGGDVPSEILEMNEKHAVITVGSNCYVLRENICPVFNRRDFDLLSTRGFKEFYCNRFVEVDGKQRRLGDTWFSHPQRRQYVGLTFNPKTTPEGYYNLWQGFAVEPISGDCSLFLKHVEENIANGNKAVYDYIIGWMAHTVQYPDILLGTALVLRGAMGVGKGVFANQFGRLFGRHYLLLSDSGQLVGRFNGHMKDTVVLFADEAFWAGDKSAEGKLKSMITEPTLSIESKGKDIATMKNHLHMIFATNNEWSVPAGPQERRFFVVDVGEKHMKDIPYFTAVDKQMENGGREALLHYLKNYDLKNVDLRKFPQTDALMEQKMYSMTPVQKFWYQVLVDGLFVIDEGFAWNTGVIQTSKLYKAYLDFADNINIKHRASDTEFGIQLKKMLPENKITTERKTLTGTVRKNHYVFPSLKECRKAFNKFFNYEINWPAE